jgi:hypothetical protein
MSLPKTENVTLPVTILKRLVEMAKYADTYIGGGWTGKENQAIEWAEKSIKRAQETVQIDFRTGEIFSYYD